MEPPSVKEQLRYSEPIISVSEGKRVSPTIFSAMT